MFKLDNQLRYKSRCAKCQTSLVSRYSVHLSDIVYHLHLRKWYSLLVFTEYGDWINEIQSLLHPVHICDWSNTVFIEEHTINCRWIYYRLGMRNYIGLVDRFCHILFILSLNFFVLSYLFVHFTYVHQLWFFEEILNLDVFMRIFQKTPAHVFCISTTCA